MGDYSERENVARLFSALEGKAREAVGTLLATSRDASAVMKTLELHFGNKRSVASKIVNELKELPAINSGQIKLTQFATKLQNAVSALKSLKLTGHLHSPDLIDIIAKKLPYALKYAYNTYAGPVLQINEKPQLEILADFLFLEAEKAIAGGICEIDDETPERLAENSKKSGSQKKTANAFAAIAEFDNEAESAELACVNVASEKSHLCVICKRDNHKTADCRIFAREPVDRRRFMARKLNLCYKCLGSGHVQAKCKSANCAQCKGRHHILLHTPKRVTEDGKSEDALGANKDGRVQQTGNALSIARNEV